MLNIIISAPEGGVVGDLYVMKTNDDINNFINNSPSETKTVAFPATFFNK